MSKIIGLFLAAVLLAALPFGDAVGRGFGGFRGALAAVLVGAVLTAVVLAGVALTAAIWAGSVAAGEDTVTVALMISEQATLTDGRTNRIAARARGASRGRVGGSAGDTILIGCAILQGFREHSWTNSWVGCHGSRLCQIRAGNQDLLQVPANCSQRLFIV